MKPTGWIWFLCKVVVLLVFVVLCLASEWLRGAALWWSFLNLAKEEVFAVFRAQDIQWMVLACISVYFIGFHWLNRQGARHTVPAQILGPLLYVASVFAYAVDYEHAFTATDALVLCFGLAVFQGIRFWQNLESGRSRPFQLAAVALAFVLLILSISVGVHRESGHAFAYRGQQRWSGLWDNPNTFGVLMGVGLVLAVGRGVSGIRGWVSGEEKADSRKLKAEIGFWAGIALLGTAAIICGIGLVKSYSRGAWVGAACGLACLVWNYFNHEIHQTHETVDSIRGNPCNPCRRFPWLRRNWLPAAAILVSLLMLAFWNYRHTEGTVVRRAFSASQANDFSWRNRVAAWEGAMQMMAEKPLLGLGWNMSERVYEQFYRAPKVDEGAAIQLNDYFTLGTTLGIPALLCFVAFVGLGLTRSAKCGMRNKETETHTSPRPSPQTECHRPPSLTRSPTTLSRSRERGTTGEGVSSPATRHTLLAAVCRSAAIVLLVGFWFDGGLFKLATGAIFFVLLELGRED